MATPADLQNADAAVQWTNGRGLVTGATMAGLFSIVLSILAGMGTWSSTGYTPNIPAGTITAAQLAPGAIAGNIGAASGAVTGSLPGPLSLSSTGVTAGSYGGASQSLSATVGADGRLTSLGSQAIALPFSALTGQATAAQLPYQSCPLTGCTLTGLLGLPAYTVATLPACAPATKDQVAVVSDATSPAYRGTLTGGGTARTIAECDGTTWLAH